MLTSTKNLSKRFLWNHRLHEEWGKERLYFWRLGFSPTYNGEAIRKELLRATEDHNVLSYAFYELTGMYDLLLRIWLPTSSTQEAFESTLIERLKGCDLQIAEVFSVSQLLMHWVWTDPNSRAIQVPSPQVLATRLKDGEIAKINDSQGKVVIHPTDELKKFEDLHLIAPCQHGPGIKFFVVIPPSTNPLSFSAREILRERLQKVLEDAEKHDVNELSLYAGSGFGQFLIMGRVKYVNFNKINDEIIEKINNIGVRSFFGVRTYTHIIAKSDSIPFQDRLPLSEEISPKEEIPIEHYLMIDESEDLEAKGSAFVDLGRWIKNIDQEPTAQDYITNNGVLKTLVAFLNTRGGKLIVGALEKKPFQDENWAESVESKLGAFPETENYFVCGVNVDYPSTKSGDWDGFQLKLQDIINQRIKPSPSSWLTTRKHDFQGKDIALITVRMPTQGWFYLVDDKQKPPKFYVRDGNRTMELSGPEADTFKSVNVRTTS